MQKDTTIYSLSRYAPLCIQTISIILFYDAWFEINILMCIIHEVLQKKNKTKSLVLCISCTTNFGGWQEGVHPLAHKTQFFSDVGIKLKKVRINKIKRKV